MNTDNNDNNQNNDDRNDNNNYQNNSNQNDGYSDYEFMQAVQQKFIRQKKRNAIILVAVVVLSIAMLFGIGMLENSGLTSFSDIFAGNNRVKITIPVQKKPELDKPYYDKDTGLYTAEGIAKKVLPSVVSIVTYSNKNPLNASSQGSGIILTENGYIITNAHVIEDATDKIRVILNDKKEYQGVKVGVDTKTDLAVIKINAKGLTAADFGKSSELSIGEEVIAIGSPAGLYGSLTKGVVSGLNRMIKTDESHIEMNCVQIDAAINPGNSGGALVNMYGQVVGINSSKFVSENYDGIGFAISFDAAKPILEKLMADGYVKDRIKIGITFYEIPEETAKIYNITAGLQINGIDEKCDVAKSGLKVGDTIVEMNGKKVYLRSDVSEILKNSKPGDTVTAKIVRKDNSGKEQTSEIKFKLMSDDSMSIENK